MFQYSILRRLMLNHLIEYLIQFSLASTSAKWRTKRRHPVKRPCHWWTCQLLLFSSVSASVYLFSFFYLNSSTSASTITTLTTKNDYIAKSNDYWCWQFDELEDKLNNQGQLGLQKNIKVYVITNILTFCTFSNLF